MLGGSIAGKNTCGYTVRRVLKRGVSGDIIRLVVGDPGRTRVLGTLLVLYGCVLFGTAVSITP